VHDAVGNEVSCAGDSLGEGRIRVRELLPLRVFAEFTSVQNMEKKA
jgi:hypothetical protein